MENDVSIRISDYRAMIDSTFETLLTITTILSGVYAAVSFDWFASAMSAPHPGEPISPEMLTQALIGVTLGLIFILPLTLIVLSWALSKIWTSTTWRTIAWSGLLYCLTQDFTGILALLAFPLIAANVFVGPILLAAVLFVIILPTTLGISLGYRVSVRYDQDAMPLKKKKSRYALNATLTVLAILIIQAILGLSIITPD